MTDWQLIVPMSGLGSRFLRAGYDLPKPLIPVLGRPIIEWVLRMFPGADDPIFICREEHLAQTEMRAILTALKPGGLIVPMEGAKLGPVHALSQAFDAIPDDRPALVTYCDYYMQWDYAAFRALMEKTGPAGSVPCYTGFHPHLLPTRNLYASCRVGDEDRLLEIREKFSFEADKTKARHSPGAYYFDSGARLKHWCRTFLATDDTIGGEYYASMLYKYMIEAGLHVTAPACIDRFCQWGTPEDLEDFLYWYDIARSVPA